MALTSGTKLGPYEILSPAGEGGMGEVYRARDTRLDRTVAVKVLSTHLADRPDLQKRLEREARTISRLTHPHICALYDVGQQEGVDFLVMEYLEGETLGNRLQRGPLPIEQTLNYGIEIAAALETAHSQGIVHRDLKPGNVMLTKAGAKLMDFGLAKLVEQPAPVAVALSEMADAPTLPSEEKSLTEEGVIVGTFQYMAPEQLEGKEADARTDIFALGMVLYEMATGRPAFTGRTKASVIAAILSSEPPPISSLQPLTPPAFDRVVKTCLAKDPEERFSTAHDVKLQLKWIAEGGSLAGVPAPVVAKRRHRERWAWVAAGLLAGIALMLAIAWYQQVRTPAPPVWASLNVSGDLSEEGSFGLSPDGSRLVYLAADPQGKLVLWVRSLDSPKAQPLEGTQGAEYPFWSPDSRNLGFFADLKLKRIEASGQGLQVLCDAPNGRGGTWNQDGVIVFAANGVGGLSRVSAAGGAPVSFTQAGTGISHRWPYFLPDNRHFLFTQAYSKTGVDGIYAGSLDSAETKEVSPGPSSNAVYASGYLLFVREGKLMAQPFDAPGLHGTGDAVLLGDGTRFAADRRIADFSAAANGMLVFRPAIGIGQRLVWFDRDGKELSVAVSDIGNATSGVLAGTLAPDGEHVAVSRARGSGSDMWIYSLKTGLGTRLTFSDTFNEGPVWSADSSKVVFTRNLLDRYELLLKSASGAGDEQVLGTANANALADSWSRDGRYLSYSNNILGSTGKMQIRAFSLQGDRKSFPAVQSESNAVGSAISPDGKWLAYTSDESGRFEVYATGFPGHAGKWQLSAGGVINGTIWVGNGAETEVIFQDLQSHLVSVPVRIQGGSLAAGAPRVLLGGRSVASSRFLDVTRDGRRILLGLPQENASTPLTLLLNWTATLKK